MLKDPKKQSMCLHLHRLDIRPLQVVYQPIPLHILLRCIRRLVQNAKHTANQIDGFLISKAHGWVVRIQGMQTVFLILLDVCLVPDDECGDLTRTPVEIMELQANKLPGYLAIPEKYGKARALKLLESYGGQRNLANISRLIDDMAAYYRTTKTVARTRLLDFGFSEVKGVRQSANGDLVPAYLSTLGKNETYTIDEAQALQEYLENEQFRKLLNSGRFVYLEGHYCLNHRNYIAEDQMGYLHLTRYAREHMSECCLVFRLSYQGAFARIVNGVLQKGGGRGRKQLTFVRYDGSPATTEEGLALRAQIEKEMAQSGEVLTNFNQMTKLLMKQNRMTISDLAEASGLSEETIKNMRNDPERIFPIQEILAVCFAMHLPYEVSEEYLRLAPSKMLNTVDMRIYRFGLINWYQLPLRTVNRRFVEAGAKPLTNDVDGFDKNGRMLKNG